MTSKANSEGMARREVLEGLAVASAALVPSTLAQAGTSPVGRATAIEEKESYRLVAPELRAALQRLPTMELDENILQMMRAGARAVPLAPLTADEQTVACEELHVPHSNGAASVRCLLYTPPGNKAARPAYLDIHGGGYVLGLADLGDKANRVLALEHDCIVLSVDYRLAPEAQYPAPLEDCYSALAYLHRQAKALGVDTARIAVGGSSAGAGHAASLTLLARSRGEFPICFQLLDWPMLDDRTGSSTPTPPLRGQFVWTPQNNRFGWKATLGVEPGTSDVPAGAVPARAADLSGLPPAFISVGALDLFLDEDMAYANRLMLAGVPTELHVIPGAYHGFIAAGEEAPQVRQILDLRRSALSRAFASSGSARLPSE